MRFGFRIPKFKLRVSSRTSWKRALRHRAGIKMPRGTAWLKSPKRAVYNRIYKKTSRGCLGVLVTGAAISTVTATLLARWFVG